jgi:hypothetical protein
MDVRVTPATEATEGLTLTIINFKIIRISSYDRLCSLPRPSTARRRRPDATPHSANAQRARRLHRDEIIRPEGIKAESFRPHGQRGKHGGARLTQKRCKSLRRRHRNLRSSFAAHHFSSHGDSYESRAGGGGQTRPVALVPAQRLRHPSNREAVARGTLDGASGFGYQASAELEPADWICFGVASSSLTRPRHAPFAASGAPARSDPQLRTASPSEQRCYPAESYAHRPGPRCLNT